MSAPVAVQLYTVREYLDKDFKGTLARIAEMGYAGIETAGYPAGFTAGDAARLFKDLGLTLCSAHVGMPIGDNVQKVLDKVMADGGDPRGGRRRARSEALRLAPGWLVHARHPADLATRRRFPGAAPGRLAAAVLGRTGDLSGRTRKTITTYCACGRPR